VEQDGTGEKRRLFVGVPLPEGLQEHVRHAQGALPPIPGLRLLKAEQWHVTLAFIGPVAASEEEIARAVVATLPQDLGGEAVIGRFLMLPSANRARVVTLELDDRDGVFDSLYEAVMRGLEAGEVMEREKRPFRPHLTIARLRNSGAVRPRYESGPAGFAVQSVCLYRSELRREGAMYTVISRRDLNPGGVEGR